MTYDDAAKLLPPQSMRQLEAALADIRHAANKLENVGIVCNDLDRAIEKLTVARDGNVQWNTRPQPAPPEGEPDFEERRAMFIDFCALHKFGLTGWPQACLDQFNTIMRRMYRLGLAARK